jgi:peptidoglycan/xylan/chitin deacetylase (PgdA/CDA1 family)
MRSTSTSDNHVTRCGAAQICAAALAIVAVLLSMVGNASARRRSEGVGATSASQMGLASADRVTIRTPPDWLLGHDWERIPTKKRVVALTFDAGSNAAGLPAIRHTLSTQDVPATFFLTGDWARTYPVKAKAVATDYRVGNHSMTHPHFTELTNEQIRSQLVRATKAIREVGGRPRPLFRFPYGDRNTRTITAVNNAGYVAVRWTVDTLGWEGTNSGITVKSIVRRVLANLKPGEIVLMHVGANPDDQSTLDADALSRVIAKLRARGYSFVTLDALLTARS